MKAIPFPASVAEAVGAPATNWEGPGIIIFKLLAVVFLVLLNGFFVASELPSSRSVQASSTHWSPKASGALGLPAM
jgi:hypothetical protein